MKRRTKDHLRVVRSHREDQDKLQHLNSVIEMVFGLTQKKRFYISDYGYGHVREVIRGDPR